MGYTTVFVRHGVEDPLHQRLMLIASFDEHC